MAAPWFARPPRRGIVLAMGGVPTLGVEEEFSVVDPRTRRTVGRARQVLEAAQEHVAPGDSPLGPGGADQFEGELHRSMAETRSAVCTTLAEVREQLVALRSELARAAADHGAAIAAAGTMPLPEEPAPDVSPDPRYRRIAELHGALVDGMATCGCHVHVAVPDRDLAVAVVDRLRRWLPVLLALSASSPLWNGRDTAYASYRSVVWGRWPSAGIPEVFGTAEGYDAVVTALLRSGAILDVGQIYWDARLSVHQPTVEVRVADVGTTVDDAVLHAGLSRALVMTCAAEAAAGAPVPEDRPVVLRAAKWRAARYGAEGALLDPLDGTPRPAAEVVRALLRHVDDALHEAGDADEVHDLATRILRRGTSAALQRREVERTGRVEAAVDLVVAATAAAP